MNEYIFDDGSLESKVLQHEIKGTVVKVKPYTKIDDWLAEIINEDDEIKKVFLHFCYEQVTPGIRAEINTALSNYPQIRIVLQYENMDRRTIENKAKDYLDIRRMKEHIPPSELLPIDEPDDIAYKILEENKHKIKTIDYGKFSVGGNDSLRSDKVTRNKDLDENDNYIHRSEHQNLFTDKINEFREKRRRKKQ